MSLESSSLHEAIPSHRSDGADDAAPRDATSARVEVVEGADRGRRALARGVELSIGTAASNDLVLTDPTVSRHHCSLLLTDDGYLLRDLGSSNGTSLGGHRIEAAFVDGEARVQVGETTLVVAPGVERAAPAARLGELTSDSPTMRRLLGELAALAASDTTLLLQGERGTGRRRLAEATHRASDRSGSGFIAIDCGALAPAALELELFGREAGGGDEGRAGVFEAAAGGTVFLAEVDQLGPELQAKVVRVLENRQVRRAGALAVTAVDVRVIASSRSDLRRAVNKKRFRGDLYDRLAGRRLEVPALRDRAEDLPALVAQLTAELGVAEVPAELVAGLARRDLGGNLEELRRVVERAVGRGGAVAVATLSGSGDVVEPAAEADPSLDFSISFRDAKEHAVARWTAIYVRELLARFEGNLSRAARTVSMDRNHLRDLLRKYVQAGATQ